MTKSAFMGGSLAFKGEKRKLKKKSKKSKHRLEKESSEARNVDEIRDSAVEIPAEEEEDMTEAERRSLKRKLERQRQENEKIATKSHRDRVEELNAHLGSLTELNDIPRVSAAGNG